ncbi:MAG: ATP-binding cassette domain-containing protein [Tannerellaceae bacterium]|nr:ATP-binding cassette domain-containing protein [Tannerellaceae bacterium]
MEELLLIDSVMISFNERDVLTDVTINCRPVDIIGLFGHNGTGKSTLLKMVFGTQWGGRKFIRINEKVIKSPAYLSGLLSYLPQEPFLPAHLTVRKITELYIPKEEINNFLGDKHLFKARDSKIGHLSGGEQRYLEIKLLLYSNTPYILLDEPFASLSPVAAESIREHIHICSAGKGIILTDHNFREVHKIANRIYLLHDGYLREIKQESDLIPYGYYPD